MSMIQYVAQDCNGLLAADLLQNYPGSLHRPTKDCARPARGLSPDQIRNCGRQGDNTGFRDKARDARRASGNNRRTSRVAVSDIPAGGSGAMWLKDIPVCLDPTDAGEARLRLAAGLASEHHAHLSPA